MGNLINEFKKSFYEGQVERDKADLRDLKFNRFGWKVVRKLTKSKKAEEMIGLYDQSIAEKEKTIKNGYKRKKTNQNIEGRALTAALFVFILR